MIKTVSRIVSIAALILASVNMVLFIVVAVMPAQLFAESVIAENVSKKTAEWLYTGADIKKIQIVMVIAALFAVVTALLAVISNLNFVAKGKIFFATDIASFFTSLVATVLCFYIYNYAVGKLKESWAALIEEGFNASTACLTVTIISTVVLLINIFFKEIDHGLQSVKLKNARGASR